MDALFGHGLGFVLIFCIPCFSLFDYHCGRWFNFLSLILDQLID